ncbi:MAG: hypothetical protein AVDCRST_MAG13-115, partial [uncultured Solirubrobacteraceae bacterium]
DLLRRARGARRRALRQAAGLLRRRPERRGHRGPAPVRAAQAGRPAARGLRARAARPPPPPRGGRVPAHRRRV